MSANYYAYVVVGFILEKQERLILVKKFDENTGKPIDKPVFDFHQAVIGGEYFDKEISKEIWDRDEFEGLSVYGNTDHNDMVLGVELAYTGDLNYPDPPLTFVPFIPEEVIKFAKKYDLTPEYFLMGRCSY